MKKLWIAAATAVLALAPGCQKSPETPVTSLTFTAGRPADGTRTGWTGETIEWIAGDAISMAYSVDGRWVGPNLYPSTPLAEGGPTAQFTVPGNFPQGLVGAHHFFAVYPAVAETDFSDAPDVHTAVPQIQTPTATSFDPKADILAGDSQEDYRSLPAYPVPLKWTRLTAHADVTLKNLPVAPGENVQSIVLQAQNEAQLTGDLIIDLANPLEFNTAGVPRVTVLADNLTFDAAGNMEFWVSIFPVDLTELTVTVTTDQATYRKVFADIDKTFTRNARNVLGVNMAGAAKTPLAPEATEYVIVKKDLEDWTGDYLIVYTPGNIAFNGALDTPDVSHNSIPVTISNGAIQRTSATDAARFTVTRSGNGYAIQSTKGYYIGWEGGKNGLSASTTALVNIISYNGTEGASIASSTGAKIRYNDGSGQERFRYYKSGQKPVQLFKLNGEAGGGGGGEQPATPTVTTGSASDITQSEAVLSATYTGTPTYGGVQWGLAANALTEDWQAAYVNNGAFHVTIDGLGPGHTYYYRAYIAVWENTDYVYYYGEVRSFTTPAGEIIIGGDQPGWSETPLMNISRNSSGYMYNTTIPSEYYAIHMCTGGEKGPGGKTARNYTVCFSAEHHCPVWVAAPRHSMYVGSAGRNDSYRVDPDVPANIQYSSTKTGGGCNKGHMLGSAERTSSKATNRDVFYYTNIAPQLSSNFNTGGGRWNVLEDYVDTQVCADTLYEVIGCYFDRYTDAYGQTQTPSKITYCGRNDVSMPTMFYYVLLRTKNGNTRKSVKDCSASELKCVAFVRSHVNVRQAVTSRELMSVADLEAITGVTYFPNVPNAPKNTFSASDWDL